MQAGEGCAAGCDDGKKTGTRSRRERRLESSLFTRGCNNSKNADPDVSSSRAPAKTPASHTHTLMPCQSSCLTVFLFPFSSTHTWTTQTVDKHPHTRIANTGKTNARDVYREAELVYLPTYVHAGPYFMGILTGFLFHLRSREGQEESSPAPTPSSPAQPKEEEESCQTRAAYIRQEEMRGSFWWVRGSGDQMNPWLNLILWLLSIIVFLVVLFATLDWNRGIRWTPLSSALYACLHRTAWSLALAWITVSCATGSGGETRHP